VDAERVMGLGGMKGGEESVAQRAGGQAMLPIRGDILVVGSKCVCCN
jgi:hypothetical protein